MAYADPGPLFDEHLDEFELIVRASENEGVFDLGAKAGDGTFIKDLGSLDYVLGWHDRHDRKLLEAARWALANGWQRQHPDHGIIPQEDA